MTAHAGGAAPPSNIPLSRREQLRREMRIRRRSLSAHEREQAGLQFASVARRHLLLQPGRHIAVYSRHASEADLGALIALARRRNCVLYLPAIANYRHSRMVFLHFDSRRRLRANRYGILEPDLRSARAVPARRLDLVLVPLIAFDACGWRLGSGAGFYDRCLQHLRAGRMWRRPRLVGVGYEFQRVPQLEPEAWDVRMDAILTEKALHPARRAP